RDLREKPAGQRLDVHVDADAQPAIRNVVKKKGKKTVVLLVDDYPDAREMYAEYLEFSGFDIVQAGNGVEAIERARDSHPDVILMDLSLPVMDGWEAPRRLKADERTRPIPVLAVTGHALTGVSHDAK